MTIIVNKFAASLADDARVVIYNCHMFIVQATGYYSRRTPLRSTPEMTKSISKVHQHYSRKRNGMKSLKIAIIYELLFLFYIYIDKYGEKINCNKN